MLSTWPLDIGRGLLHCDPRDDHCFEWPDADGVVREYWAQGSCGCCVYSIVRRPDDRWGLYQSDRGRFANAIPDGLTFDDAKAEQTEIDALATLAPDLLATMARDAISPFFDRTLAGRVQRARQEWLAAAQARIDEQDGGDLDQLREDAATALEDKRSEIEAILDGIRVDPEQFDLPEAVVPEAQVDEADQPVPLCDSGWPLDEQINGLLVHKEYMGDSA